MLTLPSGNEKFIISQKDIISEVLLQSQLHSDGIGDPAIGSL